jgi:hypothetical protein
MTRLLLLNYTALAIAAIATLALAILCANKLYTEAAVVTALALLVVLIVATGREAQPEQLTSRGPTLLEVLLLAWFATTPIASFYIRFPLERALITYDRIVLAAAVLALIIKRTRTRHDGEGKAVLATRFETVWTLLTLVVIISAVTKSDHTASAIKMAVDAFALPLVAFHLARYHFDVWERRRALLAAVAVLALLLFAIGAYELASGGNLFPYKGSEVMREAERRVNGPFASDSSYAIISLLLALFLRSAPQMLRVKLDEGAQLVYALAVAAAVAASLLPMFRAIALALVVCWAVVEAALAHYGQSSTTKPRRAILRAAAFLISVMMAIVILEAVYSSSPAQRLMNPENAYSRIATWQAAIRMAADHPIFGVGILNYTDYYDRYYWEQSYWLEEKLETWIVNSPHSNLLWITSELGLIGLAAYLLANFYLLITGYRMLTRARVVAGCYLALMAAYWIAGLTLQSGAYSDLNLYFFFLLGLLSQFERKQTRSAYPERLQSPEPTATHYRN